MTTIDDVKLLYKIILRVEQNDADAAANAATIDAGLLNLQQYQTGLIQQASTTTTAALAISTLLTGMAPTSEQLDSLTTFARTQNSYYTNVLKSANAQLGAYEAIGKAFAADAATTASFAAKFGALSPTDFVYAAYASAFTSPISASAAANLISQVAYFTDLYSRAGIPAAAAALQAKGAVYGQIVGYAVLSADAPAPAPQSDLDNRFAAALDLMADQAIAKAAPPPGGDPPVISGAQLTIAPEESISLTAASVLLKSTAGNDTVKGMIETSDGVGAAADVSINLGAGDDVLGSAATYDPASGGLMIGQTNTVKTIVIDGSAGADAMYARLTADLGTTVTLAGVEKVYLDGASHFANAKNWTGVNELWAYKTTGGLFIDNIASGVTVGVDSSVHNNTFVLAAGVPTANLALSNAAGIALLNGADLKTLNINVLTRSELQLGTTAESIVVKGSDTLKVIIVSTGVKSFDASAMTKSVTLNNAGVIDDFDPSVASTIKLGSGADTAFLGFLDKFSDSITLGAGRDAVTVTADIGGFKNVTLDAGKITTLATFTDFTKGEDTLKFASLRVATASTVGQTSLENAINHVVASHPVDSAIGITFEFGADTYIFRDSDFDGSLTDGDGLIKLTGVTGLTVGTAGPGIDLINA